MIILGKCSLVWTHSKLCKSSFELFPKFDRIIYIIRDPRDVLISRANFAFTPYYLKHFPHNEKDPQSFIENNLEIFMLKWVRHVGAYLKYANYFGIHIIFFERLLHHFDSEVKNLIEYLGYRFSQTQVDLIKHEVSFETMKANDPEHVRKGRFGNWARILNDRQKQRANTLIKDMLDYLNYPVEILEEEPFHSSDNSPFLPCLPSEMDIRWIERAMQPKQFFLKKSYLRILSFYRKEVSCI